MLHQALNIAGSEWIIIIFAALVLVLGTNKLPETARKVGRAVNEYNRAKEGMQNQFKDIAGRNIEVDGPVQSEREKMEQMARSLGLDPTGKSTAELKTLIMSRMGEKNDENAA